MLSVLHSFNGELNLEGIVKITKCVKLLTLRALSFSNLVIDQCREYCMKSAKFTETLFL